MKWQRESERGFTMVEMIVIVAVLVILGGALTPVVIKQVQKSKDQSVVDDFKAIETAVTRYHIDIGTFTPLKNIKGFDTTPAGATFKHFVGGDGEHGWNGPYLSRVKSGSSYGGKYDIQVVDEDKAYIVLGNKGSLGDNYSRVLSAVNEALDGDDDTAAGVVWGDKKGINFGINYYK